MQAWWIVLRSESSSSCFGESGGIWLQLGVVQERESYGGQAVHFERLPARMPRYRDTSIPLSPAVVKALASRGIERLFEHQAQVPFAVAGPSQSTLCTVLYYQILP